MSAPGDTISDICAILERDGHLVERTDDPPDGDATALETVVHSLVAAGYLEDGERDTILRLERAGERRAARLASLGLVRIATAERNAELAELEGAGARLMDLWDGSWGSLEELLAKVALSVPRDGVLAWSHEQRLAAERWALFPHGERPEFLDPFAVEAPPVSGD